MATAVLEYGFSLRPPSVHQCVLEVNVWLIVWLFLFIVLTKGWIFRSSCLRCDDSLDLQVPQ
jgi:hypothetical protein